MIRITYSEFQIKYRGSLKTKENFDFYMNELLNFYYGEKITITMKDKFRYELTHLIDYFLKIPYENISFHIIQYRDGEILIKPLGVLEYIFQPFQADEEIDINDKNIVSIF